jgi:hypothetical protein
VEFESTGGGAAFGAEDGEVEADGFKPEKKKDKSKKKDKKKKSKK